jgi:hypothetical protein
MNTAVPYVSLKVPFETKRQIFKYCEIRKKSFYDSQIILEIISWRGTARGLANCSAVRPSCLGSAAYASGSHSDDEGENHEALAPAINVEAAALSIEEPQRVPELRTKWTQKVLNQQQTSSRTEPINKMFYAQLYLKPHSPRACLSQTGSSPPCVQKVSVCQCQCLCRPRVFHLKRHFCHGDNFQVLSVFSSLFKKQVIFVPRKRGSPCLEKGT